MTNKEYAEYRKKVDACDCISAERKSYIQSALDFAEDFPNGAFMAYLDEQGIDVSELDPWDIKHKCSSPESAETGVLEETPNEKRKKGKAK